MIDPAERQMRKREAGRRLRDQRRRVGALRSRAIATSLACFALLWAVVFVQMATGNDPVLGGGRRAAGAAAAPPASRTGSEEAGAAAAEDTETAAPAESEPEVVEPELIGPEPVEVIEPEPEPVPVETAQS
jgi:hypothetical protein